MLWNTDFQPAFLTICWFTIRLWFSRKSGFSRSTPLPPPHCFNFTRLGAFSFLSAVNHHLSPNFCDERERESPFINLWQQVFGACSKCFCYLAPGVSRYPTLVPNRLALLQFVAFRSSFWQFLFSVICEGITSLPTEALHISSPWKQSRSIIVSLEGTPLGLLFCTSVPSIVSIPWIKGFWKLLVKSQGYSHKLGIRKYSLRSWVHILQCSLLEEKDLCQVLITQS